MVDFTWKIGGEAGFGIMTTGLVFSKIASRSGYYIFDYIKYPSLIRGGHNTYEIRISSDPISSLKLNIDVLVCLNKETFEKDKSFLNSDSKIIYDEEEFDFNENFQKINVPFKKILSNLKGQAVMKNTIALGVSLALVGGELDRLLKIITEQFEKKGEEVVNFNKKFAETGYNYVKDNYSHLITNWLTKRTSTEKLVMSGNDAFSLGSVIADCRLYSAYPMTPASSVLTTLAGWQKITNMIVRHAEDEISVINTALGSSFAGVRSAIGTSGGGFALMVESIALAGITEIPVVIFLAQRPGPATGMPTWTEQADLLFAVHAGHGEFPKIVLAPGDIEEMIFLTAEAFNLADIYQTPLIILSDMFLSESHQSTEKQRIDKFISNYKVNRGRLFNKAANEYNRYEITNDGISPRLIPGITRYFYQANSYEHLEDSHTTEESKPRQAQVDKRNRKTATYLQHDFRSPRVYGDLKSSEIVFVSWGSIKGAILEAQKKLNGNSLKTALIHFNHLYPLSEEKIKPLFNSKKRYILIENNSQAQFGKLLRQETGIIIREKLLRYDGRPIWPEEIVNYVRKQ